MNPYIRAVYEPGRRTAANLMTHDEARIAVNIASYLTY
jgi:hypothetical protein